MLILSLLFFFFLFGLGYAAGKGYIPTQPYSSQSIPFLNAYKIYDLVNNYRASKNLNKLKFNPQMCSYTATRAKEIQTDWSHNGFWNNPPFWVNNLKGDYAGENLATNYVNEQTTVQAWLASPEHLANIIKLVYTDTCVTVSEGNDGQTYVVQEFSSNF